MLPPHPVGPDGIFRIGGWTMHHGRPEDRTARNATRRRRRQERTAAIAVTSISPHGVCRPPWPLARCRPGAAHVTSTRRRPSRHPQPSAAALRVGESLRGGRLTESADDWREARFDPFGFPSHGIRMPVHHHLPRDHGVEAQVQEAIARPSCDSSRRAANRTRRRSTAATISVTKDEIRGFTLSLRTVVIRTAVRARRKSGARRRASRVGTLVRQAAVSSSTEMSI